MNTLSHEAGRIVKETFNFDVKPHRLNGPDIVATSWWGLFRDDTWEPVGPRSVSPRYTAHTTDDVVALTEAGCQVFDGIMDLKCYFSDGHHVVLQPSSEYRQAIYGTNDNVFPRGWIQAGYNGTCFSASLGLHRDLCRNEMMLQSVSQFHVKIKHTRSLRAKMDDLIQQFQGLRAGWSNLVDTIRQMENRQVSMKEFLIDVYGAPEENSGRSRTIHTNRVESIFRRLTRERMRSGRPELARVDGGWMVSAWEAFNAIQGYEQHDASRKGNPSDFERILKANSSPNVRRAETLALAG